MPYINPNVKINEALEFEVAMDNSTVTSGWTPASQWFSVRNIRRVIAIAHVESVTTSFAFRVKLEQDKTGDGSNVKDLTSANEVTAGYKQSAMVLAESPVNDLDNDFHYVRANVFHDDSGQSHVVSALIGFEPMDQTATVPVSDIYQLPTTSTTTSAATTSTTS